MFKYLLLFIALGLSGCLKLNEAKAEFVCKDHSELYDLSFDRGLVWVVCNDGYTVKIQREDFQMMNDPLIAEYLKKLEE